MVQRDRKHFFKKPSHCMWGQEEGSAGEASWDSRQHPLCGMGTWCPNCQSSPADWDTAINWWQTLTGAFLVSLLKKKKKSSVQVSNLPGCESALKTWQAVHTEAAGPGLSFYSLAIAWRRCWAWLPCKLLAAFICEKTTFEPCAWNAVRKKMY